MILIDGDIIVYRVGWASEDETEEVALSNLRSFTGSCFGFIADELEEYQIYLSGPSSENFRHGFAVTQPYKGNRKDFDRPKYYDLIRETLINEWGAVVTVGEEADDAIATAATEIQSVQTPAAVRAVMASVDKDFWQIPGLHYNFVKNEMKMVTPIEAIDNFYAQILTGDRVDNIIGLKGIGPVKADRILKACDEEITFLGKERCYFVACVKAYMDVEGLDSYRAKLRVEENARLLWLRRQEGQVWEDPHDRKESYYA